MNRMRDIRDAHTVARGTLSCAHAVSLIATYTPATRLSANGVELVEPLLRMMGQVLVLEEIGNAG